MKLFAGIAISLSILIGSETIIRPDPFFVRGNKIIYECNTQMKKGKGYTSHQVFVVDKVIGSGSSVSSECTMGYYDDDDAELRGFRPYYRVYYDADTVNFYFRSRNWCYVPVDYSDYTTFDANGDSLIYPLAMQVGDSLPDAFASTSYSLREVRVSYSIRFSKRKVLAQDTVSTAFGKVAAFKISMDLTYDVKSFEGGNGGGTRNLENRTITEWFAPQYGIIKMQHTGVNGNFSSEMISYKGK